MLTWIIYDISDDKLRSLIGKICKNYGLYRVQKSVFLGTLNSTEFDSIYSECDDLIDKETDSIFFFPVCEVCFKKIKISGISFDKNLIQDKIKTQFF